MPGLRRRSTNFSGALEKLSGLFRFNSTDRIALSNIIGRCPQLSEMTDLVVGSVSPPRG
jgi:hypothetical protein